MPGEDSADNRPPAHKVEVVTGDRDNTGVYTEENRDRQSRPLRGEPRRLQLPGQGK